ncbi:MAG: signal recognition particle protein [Alphaproteobacteria bacterium]|nr:signal recognition particle protein [Alphaproteobacteria bacterium]
MFDSFTEKISGIFDRLRGSGILRESDVDVALREIRMTLLEADVSLDVARKFISEVKQKAIGQQVLKSVSPGQMVVKIVHDYIVELLGKSEVLELRKRPYKIMMVGLQGAGKTTTVGKLANFFSKKNKKAYVVSTDIYRPAAIDQLKILSEKVSGAVFDQSTDDLNLSAVEISKNAMKNLRQNEADVLIVDTAGRLHIDEIKMDELRDIKDIIQPDEILLVANIMTGQEALNVAAKFSEVLNITGVILTQVDGDARGGVALSMRSVTGCPIKFLGTGEHLDNLEIFDAERIAGRLLGMGDVVSLVEKAQEAISEEEALAEAKKMQEGIFTLDDYAKQMERMSKLGGLKGIVKMLPKSQMIEKAMDEQGISDNTIARSVAIVRSMTRKERNNYKILNGSRRKRIANGSGTSVQEVNRLIKQYEAVLTLFKQVKSGGFAKMLGSFRR